MRLIALAFGLAIGVLALAGLGYIRFAPAGAQAQTIPADVFQQIAGGPVDEVVAGRGSAMARLSYDALAKLARLAAVADAAPRTVRLAGTVDEGRITWVTRSALIGFPDYTTAELREGELVIWARPRFGQRDFGVNSERLQSWLEQL
jgi:hypothetical protein